MALLALSACNQENENLTRATSAHPEGRIVFDQYNCGRCHEGGEGGLGKRLVGNEALKDIGYVRSRIRDGKGAMPAYPQLSEEELADVSAFVRTLAGWE